MVTYSECLTLRHMLLKGDSLCEKASPVPPPPNSSDQKWWGGRESEEGDTAASEDTSLFGLLWTMDQTPSLWSGVFTRHRDVIKCFWNPEGAHLHFKEKLLKDN